MNKLGNMAWSFIDSLGQKTVAVIMFLLVSRLLPIVGFNIGAPFFGYVFMCLITTLTTVRAVYGAFALVLWKREWFR